MNERRIAAWVIARRAGESSRARNLEGLLSVLCALKTPPFTTIDAILSAGCNPSPTDTDGFTPAHYAVFRNHDDVVLNVLTVLARHGADINAPLRPHAESRTPAHLAVQNGKLAALDALGKLGANLAACASTQQTPAHYAAWYAKEFDQKMLIDTLDILTRNGVSLTTIDALGRQPIDLSHDSVSHAIIERAIARQLSANTKTATEGAAP